VTAVGWMLDGGVVALMLVLAVRVVVTRDLFEATILFVSLGLTLAVAWIRLGAPDVALAEAALGAGLMGALLLNAFQRLARRTGARPAGEIRATLGDDEESDTRAEGASE